MSDRKYRQHGYQDSDRPPREAPRPKAPPPERAPGRQLQDAAGPKTPNLMASHEVFRCARCGNRLGLPVTVGAKCGKCGVAVHSCLHCVSFDTSARFECAQAISARVSPKDDDNLCTLFQARTTVERETSTAAAPGGKPSARQAFDDLFN